MSKFKQLLNVLMSSGNELEPELNKNLSIKADSLPGKVETFTDEVTLTQKQINAAHTIGSDLETLSICDDVELQKFHVADWVASEVKQAEQELERLKARLVLLNSAKAKSILANDHLSSDDNQSPFVNHTSFEKNCTYQLIGDSDKLICVIKRD